MTLINALPLWSWGVLALVPVAIVLLYFLKLRRRPVEVPSTYLWSRTIEDMHVNSLWQRLRNNLLLWLQLLFLLLAMFALLRPGAATDATTTQRLILLIDHSSSMNAVDGNQTRLISAKQRALEMVEAMPTGSVAMVIAFSDRARVVQSYTDNRPLLRRKIDEIEPTERPTRIDEALRAASGLANPPQTYEEGNPNALRLAQALEAKLVLLTDGGWKAPTDFALGNLKPVYEPIGRSRPAENVGIVAFSTAENSEKPGEVQAFAQLFNCSPSEKLISLKLLLDGRTIDAQRDRRVGPGATVSLTFDIPRSLDDAVVGGVLELIIETPDDFAADNVARAVFDTRRQAKVLVVTAGNDPLEFALETDELLRFAEIRFEKPEFLSTEVYRQLSMVGAVDLMVFDRCQPTESPAANTCYIDAVPPEEGWSLGERVEPLTLIDADLAHPLVEWLEFAEVLIAEGSTVVAPPGSRSVVRADAGPAIVIGERLGFRDAVVGFPIVIADEEGNEIPNTDWPRHPSFPMFVQNLVQVLGNAARLNEVRPAQPGQMVEVRSVVPYPELEIVAPDGSLSRAMKGRQNVYLAAGVERLGVYRAQVPESETVVQRFVVNLTDRQESELQVPAQIELGYQDVGAGSGRSLGRSEYWKLLLLLAAGVLMVEWFVYRRRV